MTTSGSISANSTQALPRLRSQARAEAAASLEPRLVLHRRVDGEVNLAAGEERPHDRRQDVPGVVDGELLDVARAAGAGRPASCRRAPYG